MPPGFGHTPDAPQRGQQITASFLQDLAANIGRLNQFSAPNAFISAGGVSLGNEQTAATPQWNNNTAPTACPAYGCFKLNGEHGDSSRNIPLYYGKRSITYGSQYSHFFNSEWDVDEGAWGEIQQGTEFIARYAPGDYTTGAPAVGDLLGPRNGSWELRKNTGGFIVVGLIDTSTDFLVRVQRLPFTFARGTTIADIAAHGQGLLRIGYGAGGGQYTGEDLVNVYNLTDCTIKANKQCSANWIPETDEWMFITFGTS